MKNFWQKHWSNIVLVFILLAGIFLRFWNLNSTPGWWPDEGVYLNIANNLLHGKAQMLSFSYPFVPHPPLYFIIVAGFIKFFGYKMIAIRLASAVMGTILIYIVYLIGKSINKIGLGLIAAFFVAVMPEMVVFSRYGLTYNLLILLIGLVIYFTISYTYTNNNKYLVWGALLSGLALVTSYSGIVLVAFWFILLFYHYLLNKITWEKLLSKSILLAGPFLVYLGWELLFNHDSFIHDIIYTLGRNFESSSINSFIQAIISLNIYLVFGFLGLLFLPKNIKYWVILLFIMIIGSEYFMRGGFVWYSTTYIFILYFGLASFIDFITNYETEKINNKSLKKLVYLGIILIVIGALSLNNIFDLYFKISNKNWLEAKLNIPQERIFSVDNKGQIYLDEAINYINSRVTAVDTVVSSPQFSWMINAKPSDPILSYVYRGKSTTNFTDDMKSSGRFIYDPSYEKAKFLLDDKFMRNWYYNQNGIRYCILDDIYTNWTRVYEKGDIRIFKNPNY
ncbi:MAG: hypothetical protein ACD_58C00146G0009 [uncultured bacterium]|nr:MAG: hypothetical protein ACD_58C00146G0009 [uncultured bacterium]